MSTLALVGGQYGSEGKGVIAAGLAHHFDAAVRTGGPNAGHSFYYQHELYKMRSVPCAWVNTKTKLFIGAGAVLDPALLVKEAEMTQRVVFVDPHAAIILPSHHEAEAKEGLQAAIGSTLEGVGAARISKIKRNGYVALAQDFDFESERIVIEEVAPHLEEVRETGGWTMLEGTQGSSLSLHHGRYPFVTSNDTNAAQLAADAGVPPTSVEHTHLVVRTYPIRVAGNSGDTGGKEIDWQVLVDRGVVEKPERTTVTNNVRRIFEFDDDDYRRAIRLNDPCGVWVTFGDYLDPGASGVTDIDALMRIPAVSKFVSDHIVPAGVRLLGIGVGGQYWKVAETGDSCFRVGPHWPIAWGLKQHE